MPTNNWAVIYCPKEGLSRNHRRWKKIRSYLDRQGISYDYVQSDSAGSIERLASMMTRAGYNTLIIVGGDAALNHALCGIMQTVASTGGRIPTLGVIPNGFGNDFAKYWGFSPSDYKSTIRSLLLHHTRRVDVANVRTTDGNGHTADYHFLNCLNLGVASSITNIRRKTRRFFGLNTLSYATSALLLLFHRLEHRFCFSMSGERVDRKAMTICVGSARGYGQTPSAVPYNGLLDVTLVSKPLITQIFHGLWLLFTHRFLSHRGVAVWRTNHIRFTHTGRAQLSIDGRVIHHPVRTVDISIEREKINFLIP